MAYYNNYPNNLMPGNQWQYQYQNNYNQLATQQASNDERIWVSGRNSADAYLVAPNSFVRLWDSNASVFYEKRTDATGRPFPMEVYEYKRIAGTEPTQTGTGINYAEQIKNLEIRLSELEKGMVKRNEQSNADDTAIQSI